MLEGDGVSISFPISCKRSLLLPVLLPLADAAWLFALVVEAEGEDRLAEVAVRGLYITALAR